jgi:hypothetical protein
MRPDAAVGLLGASGGELRASSVGRRTSNLPDAAVTITISRRAPEGLGLMSA